MVDDEDGRKQAEIAERLLKGVLDAREKDKVLADLEVVFSDLGTEDTDLKITAELKVMLLADYREGGLSEVSRKRAWRAVHELGQILRTRRGQN